MDWTQVCTVIGVNVALIAAMATLIVWAINKLDVDVKWAINKLDTDINALGERVEKLGNRLDGHATRIDQLYQMFVQLLKEKK